MHVLFLNTWLKTLSGNTKLNLKKKLHNSAESRLIT